MKIYLSLFTILCFCKVYAVKDPHSYSAPEKAVVTNLKLDLNVDFETHILSGTAEYDITQNGASEIILDTRNLAIESVSDGQHVLKFKLSADDKILGKALSIGLKPSVKHIVIKYHTTSGADALQWLSPSQTAGKTKPFLFTQSQAILARTWIPCQDSPGIRFTYSARIKVPKGMLALMSAENPQTTNDSGIYHFKQRNAIPAYLMALAAGDITFRKIGDRTGVYGEPAIADKALYEFAETEQMLKSAERLYGPYRWDRYDLLVLPPSFPFGGMENPCLTFATPTVITGDRSLTSLVAHEMAHSWSGNLVTNATWNDFWLNEGFTNYFERRIMEVVYGSSYTEMLIQLGYEDLQSALKELGPTSPDTRLKLELDKRNPDDGVTDIAYEKGFSLLKLLEFSVGRKQFDSFLNKYFHEHEFKAVTTEDFVKNLKEGLFAQQPGLYDYLQVQKWIYEPGLPQNCPITVSSRFLHIDTLAARFLKTSTTEGIETGKWTSHEWQHFVRQLAPSINIFQMRTLDAAFHLTETGNSEILEDWLQVSIKNGYKPAFDRMEKFLVEVGRRKYVLPLYKMLSETPNGKEIALNIYKKARPNYHAVTVVTVDELLNYKAQ